MQADGPRPSEGRWGTLLIVGGLAIILLPYAPAQAQKSALSLQIAIGLSCVAFLLSLIAMIATRKSRWMPKGSLRPEMPRRGIHNIVRHPMYTALIIQAFATAFAVSWWLWMFTGMFFLVLGVDLRATADDLILADLFQEEFLEFQAATKSYLPLVH